MLVSHDRALLREVCDEFWIVTAGSVQPFDGDLDDYQRWLLDVGRAVTRGVPPPPRPGPAATPPSPRAQAPAPAAPSARDDRKRAAQVRAELANRTRPLRTEVQRIYARLDKLAAERAEIEARLAVGSMPGAEIAEAGRRLNHVAAEVAMLEERWLELHAEIDAIQAAAG